MKGTERKATWRSKKQTVTRWQTQRKRINERQIESLKDELEASQYKYVVSPTIYSDIKCQMNELGLTRQLPGRDAVKEMLTFLETFKSLDKKCSCYNLALESARYRVQGRRFFDKLGRKHIIRTTDDVELVMKESLRAARIDEISVEDFIYSQLK